MTKLRCFDNGGKTLDRYTIIPPRTAWREYRNPRNGLWTAIAASTRPFDPQGFGQATEAAPGGHLGERIPFESLPRDVQTYARLAFPDHAH